MRKGTILFTLLAMSITCAAPMTAYAEDVTITFPAGSDMSQYPGSEKGIVNEDGSITFTLNDELQEEWRKIADESMEESVSQLLNDDAAYPCLVDLQYNEDMTEFTITYTGEPSMQESMVYSLYPYWIAPLYQQICGIPESEVDYKLITINQDTKEESVSSYADAVEMAKSLGMDYSTGENSEGVQGSSETTTNVTNSDFEYQQDGFAYKYLKNQVIENTYGEKSVYVFFEFTNNSGQTCTPASSLAISAFQNGVQLDYMMPDYENVPEEANTAYKQVQDGTTVNIALRYILSDDSNVSLEISPYFYNQDTQIGKYTFSLTK